MSFESIILPFCFLRKIKLGSLNASYIASVSEGTFLLN